VEELAGLAVDLNDYTNRDCCMGDSFVRIFEPLPQRTSARSLELLMPLDIATDYRKSGEKTKKNPGVVSDPAPGLAPTGFSGPAPAVTEWVFASGQAAKGFWWTAGRLRSGAHRGCETCEGAELGIAVNVVALLAGG